jgi:lysophospholipase L1-like esterase
MKVKHYKKLAILCVIGASFLYGLLVVVYKLFPYEIIKNIKNGTLVQTGIEPNHHHKYRLDQFRMFPSHAKNVMVGDSITHVGHWKEIFPEYSILNRGIGADKTTDILSRIDTVLDSNPEKVFLMMGVNDFNIGRRSVGDVFSTYRTIIEELERHNIEVIIQSTIECDNCGHDGKTNQKVRELNTLLYDYSKSNDLTFIDLNSLMSDENGLKKSYQEDSVHPNAEGYKVWASMIDSYLTK